MKTSNFANNKRYSLNGISISRYPDKRSGFNGPEFPPLFPSEQLLKEYKNGVIVWDEYTLIYNAQLECLNAEKVWRTLGAIATLSAGEKVEPILLCYESAKTLSEKPCHRRLVADWFERELGVVVPEWNKSMLTGDCHE